MIPMTYVTDYGQVNTKKGSQFLYKLQRDSFFE